MKLLYFAWLREKVGLADEQVPLPENVATVGGLLDWLKERGAGHAEALEDLSAIRVAVNQEYAGLEVPVADSDEVALFPPVTGG